MLVVNFVENLVEWKSFAIHSAFDEVTDKVRWRFAENARTATLIVGPASSILARPRVLLRSSAPRSPELSPALI